jgi:hypothetical protein
MSAITCGPAKPRPSKVDREILSAPRPLSTVLLPVHRELESLADQWRKRCKRLAAVVFIQAVLLMGAVWWLIVLMGGKR